MQGSRALRYTSAGSSEPCGIQVQGSRAFCGIQVQGVPNPVKCRGPGPCAIQVQGSRALCGIQVRGPEPSVVFKCRGSEPRIFLKFSDRPGQALWYASAGSSEPCGINVQGVLSPVVYKGMEF